MFKIIINKKIVKISAILVLLGCLPFLEMIIHDCEPLPNFGGASAEPCKTIPLFILMIPGWLVATILLWMGGTFFEDNPLLIALPAIIFNILFYYIILFFILKRKK